MSNTTRTLGIVAIEPKGEYDATAYYEKLNTVIYNDSTYMALKSSTGVLPTNTEYWQLIGGGVTKEYLDEEVDEKLEDFTMAFDTVALMKESTYLKAGMTVKTLGYYSLNDGGGATYKIVETTSNYKEELNNGLYAELIIKDKVIIEQLGAYGDDTHNDAPIFQTAVLINKPIYLSNKTYLLNNKITINEQTQIIGQSMTNTILNVSHNDYAFEYLSPVASGAYAHKTNVKLINFKVNCTNFIRINDNTLEQTQWVKQGSLLGLQFKNLWIKGKYSTMTDSNKESNVLPTLDNLLSYGCGFNCSSLFDSAIVDCRIEDFGLGIYFKGCDINRIEHNRLNGNGCHIYLERCSTYGSQTLILHNDILHNLRYGGIRVSGTNFDTIEDNYFENYTASACAIYGDNERETSIINNRFDNPTQADIDIIRLAPANTDIICNNRVNPSNADQHCYIKVLSDNIGNFNNIMSYNTAKVIGNNGKLEERNNPLTLDDNVNKLLISPYNVKFNLHRMGGTRFVQPYFILDTTDNLYYFSDTTASGTSLILQFLNLKKNYAKYPKIRFKYKSSETTMYVQVRGDGNTLYGNNVNLTNDNTIHTVDLDLSTNENIYDLIRIELPVKAGVKLYSVELI